MIRSREHPAAALLSRRLFIASFASAIVASALLGASAAHATLGDEVNAVTADVESVTESANKALPGTPVPIETPGLPKVPAPSSPASKPSPQPPSSAPATAANDAAETAVPALGGGTEGAAKAPSETAGPVATAAPGPGAGGANPAARGPDRRSIGAAETAPPLRWRAYVWPAIALGVSDALASLLVPLEGMTGVRVPDVFGLLSPPAMPASAEPPPGGSDVPATRADQPSQPPWVALSEDGMGLLAALVVGLLVVAGFVSLARLVVGEELFESRYWRGHRG